MDHAFRLGGGEGRIRRGAALLAWSLGCWPVAFGGAPTAEAQEAEAEAPRRSACPLILESKETTVGNRILEGRAYVTYLGGGMLWRCGNAEMEADSAVRYEAARRVEMMGNVRYRDTIRTLESDRLTYHELPDLVVATGSVHLTRLASGSTLTGPRVEFLRAVSGREALTTATERPHLTLRTDPERQRPPFEVDADVTVMAGEEMAWARGDVRIQRPDLTARADSVFFDIEKGRGVLIGSPEIEGRGFRLSGDTVRLAFEEDDLREVRATGRGRATGEAYELLADEILASLREEEVEAVWGFGPGRALGVSSPYRVFGDSLRFALSDGQIDTVVSVGRAVAVELGSEGEADGGPPAGEGTAGAGPLARPAVVVEGGPSTEVPEGIAEHVVPDTLLAGLGTDRRAVEAEAAAVQVAPGAGRRAWEITEPQLTVDEETNWMVGDTLWAIFDPVEEASAAGEAVDGETAADRAGDAGSRRRLSRIRVVGGGTDARAFYAAVRDTTRASRLSRSYMIGRAIEILFRDGEVHRVRGERAIGVYLDPMEGGGPGPPSSPAEPPVPPDTVAPPPPSSSEAEAVRDSIPGQPGRRR